MSVKRALEDERLDECAVMLLRNLGYGVAGGTLLPAVVSRRPMWLLATTSLGVRAERALRSRAVAAALSHANLFSKQVGFAVGATSRECAALLASKPSPAPVVAAKDAGEHH